MKILILLCCLSTSFLYAADACCAVAKTAEAATAFSDNSLFHLPAAFVNTDGEAVKLADYQGKPFVLAMFYASCPTICPRLIQDVVKIESELSETEKTGLPIVLVSFDPETDTPDNLTTFAKNWEMDTPRWQLWSGKPEDSRTLAASLGIRYRKGPDGEISHSAPITLVNAQGEIVLQLAGPGVDPSPLIKQVKTLLSEPAK